MAIFAIVISVLAIGLAATSLIFMRLSSRLEKQLIEDARVRRERTAS